MKTRIVRLTAAAAVLTGITTVWASGVIVYDNGTSTHSGGAAIGHLIAAADFVLAADVSITGASVDVSDGRASESRQWDHAVRWWILSDNEGKPGSVIATGTGKNIVQSNVASDVSGKDFTVTFDFGQEIACTAGTTYWLALHFDADFSRTSVFWDHANVVTRNPAYGGIELAGGLPTYGGQYFNALQYDLAFRITGNGTRHRLAGRRVPIYVYMNFDGNAFFPNLTAQKDTTGLAMFTGHAFHLPTSSTRDSDGVIDRVMARVAEDFQEWDNIRFVRSTTGPDFWYTWGIDDSSYVYAKGDNIDPSWIPFDAYAPCPSPTGCSRLWGKARGGNTPDENNILTGQPIVYPTYARSWGGSFSLMGGSVSPSDPLIAFGEDLDMTFAGGGNHVIGDDTIARTIANSASHEIAHLLGVGHSDCGDKRYDLMCQWSEGFVAAFEKTFSSSAREVLRKRIMEWSVADQFEPSDSPEDSSVVAPGTYDLTLDSPVDVDYYTVPITEDGSTARLTFTFDRTHYAGIPAITAQPLHHWATASLVSQVINTGWWTVSNDSYTFERHGISAGTSLVFAVRQRHPRVPMPYTMSVSYPVPSVAIAAAIATITESRRAPAAFTVGRTGSTQAPLTVHYTEEGTAKGQLDYRKLRGKVTIPAGSADASILITPINDALEETDETVVVSLAANPAYELAASSSGVMVISSNDQHGITVDNLPAGSRDASRQFSGKWCYDGVPGFYGQDALHSCGRWDDEYRWIPEIRQGGAYDVYIWCTSTQNRSASVSIAVTHAQGTKTATVSQHQQGMGSRWIPLGTYKFRAGTSGSVSVRETGNTETRNTAKRNVDVCADAVRFVRAE